MRIKSKLFMLMFFLLLLIPTMSVIAHECVPACTGCQTCEAGVCVDDDDKCGGSFCCDGTCCSAGQCCDDGSCVNDCPSGECCYEGDCVSSCPTGQCCDDGTCESSCPTGQCCDDGECVDDCPSGECCDDGDCEPMEMDSVTSDQDSACVDCDITFTATTDPVGYEDDVEWSGGGEPSTGSGSTFTTHWDTSGPQTVTAELCDSEESKQVTIVEVDKVVKAGTTDEGPIYLCPQSHSVDLEAKPDPSDASFPSDEPHWEVVSQPEGASASLSPSSGSATTTLSNITGTGEYIIKAKCGDSDTGDTIVVSTEYSNQHWESLYPSFGSCPPGADIFCLLHYASTTEDDCSNEVIITCHEPLSDCRYEYWYRLWCDPVKTQVGGCVWVGGINNFYVRVTDGYTKIFTKTWHCTENNAKGIDSDGEGCPDYYCWRVQKYDLLKDMPVPGSPWWRRDDSFAGTSETEGEECLGEGGNHPGYPN